MRQKRLLCTPWTDFCQHSARLNVNPLKVKAALSLMEEEMSACLIQVWGKTLIGNWNTRKCTWISKPSQIKTTAHSQKS